MKSNGPPITNPSTGIATSNITIMGESYGKDIIATNGIINMNPTNILTISSSYKKMVYDLTKNGVRIIVVSLFHFAILI
jgi:ABC-type hemin transport system substrate-binding protein